MHGNRAVELVVTLAVVLSLLSTGIGSAWASPPPQAGTESFQKPGWGLTLQYPTGWTVEDEPNYVRVTLNLPQDSAGLVVVRKPAYTADTDLEAVFVDVLQTVGGGVARYSLTVAPSATIAGVEARGVHVTATDTSGTLPMSGYLASFVKAGTGYALLAVSPSVTWYAHQLEFVGIIDSLQINAVSPANTPRPTRRARATATPTEATAPTEEAAPTEELVPTEEAAPTEEIAPTEEAAPTEEIVPTEEAAPTEEIVPTEEAAPTEEIAPTEEVVPTEAPTAARTPQPAASGLTTAREAYELAVPEAQKWNDGATFVEAMCMNPDVGLADANAGKCARWVLSFSDNPGDPDQAQGRAIVVADGKLDAKATFETSVRDSAPPSEDWLDSTDALQAFLTDGGAAGFLERYPEAIVTQLMLGSLDRDDPVTWRIGATAKLAPGQSLQWAGSLDAVSGAVDGSPEKASKRATKYTTAREALGLLQDSVAAWDQSAELTQVRGVVMPNEPGYAAGKVGEWYFEFRGQEDALEYHLSGTQVDSEKSATDREVITGDWLDSAAVLKKLRDLPDYAAFVKLYPKPAFYFLLEVDEDLGLTWDVTAEVQGADLGLKLSDEPALTSAAPVTPTPAG